MNCDPLARIYSSLEYLAFARQLERQRFLFLDEALDTKRALLLGEGDGRFVSELATRNHNVEIDCVEKSAKMIEVAQRRLRDANIPFPDRVRFHRRDARLGFKGQHAYDLVVSHFFLDCFSDADSNQIISSVRGLCKPGAKWLIAEFQQPARGWRKWYARCWLALMYWFFRITTQLSTRQLPQYHSTLSAEGFLLRRCSLTGTQMICSELWELPGSSPFG